MMTKFTLLRPLVIHGSTKITIPSIPYNGEQNLHPLQKMIQPQTNKCVLFVLRTQGGPLDRVSRRRSETARLDGEMLTIGR